MSADRQAATKGKYDHGGTRHGGQAGDTEKCLEIKAKPTPKPENTEKAGRVMERTGKGARENLHETKKYN